MDWAGIIVLVVLGIIVIWGLWQSMEGSFPPDNTHHDNRPGSHYYESQRALREKREEHLK